jgi:hypothetical protein
MALANGEMNSDSAGCAFVLGIQTEARSAAANKARLGFTLSATARCRRRGRGHTAKSQAAIYRRSLTGRGSNRKAEPPGDAGREKN